MNSLVLDLQQEVLNPDCNTLNALRKAHLIAIKLKLEEFDLWIQSELNGYDTAQNKVPNYRKVTGQIKAWNPYNGWIPVILQDSKLEDRLCTRKIANSVSSIVDLYNNSKGCVVMNYPANVNEMLNSCSVENFETYYSLHINKSVLKAIIDKITTCLLEWTIKLEKEGIVGENMQFSESETAAAQTLPQQINYYGPVVLGNVNDSQIISGDNNDNSYNATELLKTVCEIRDALGKDEISDEDKENALEILEDISEKIDQNKKSTLIKATFLGLRDFALNAGANITASLITAKIQGLF